MQFSVILPCMIISGNSIADKIQKETKRLILEQNLTPKVVFLAVDPNPITCRYIERKKIAASQVGIKTTLVQLPEYTDNKYIQDVINDLSRKHDAIVVQLPLPVHIDTKLVCDSFPREKDVDSLHSDSLEKEFFIQPVAGAVKEICAFAGIELSGLRATVVGYGKLVGQPVAVWLKRQGVEVDVVTKEIGDLNNSLQKADLVVSGAGVPNLIKPSMLKSGCILIDASTSEQLGKLTGDADPGCANVCSVFTPVPGGVGPITIAVLMRNIYKATYANELQD